MVRWLTSEVIMSNKLFIGNLAFSLTEEQLKEEFGAFGSVNSVKIITDRMTGRSRGFGFIEMENADGAQEAISSLDGKDLDGRAIRVNIAEDKPKRENNDRGGNRW